MLNSRASTYVTGTWANQWFRTTVQNISQQWKIARLTVKKNVRLGAVQRVLQRQTLTPGCHANYMRDALCPLHTWEPVPTINSSTAGSHEWQCQRQLPKAPLSCFKHSSVFRNIIYSLAKLCLQDTEQAWYTKNHLPKSSPPLYTFFRELPKYYPPRQFTCCNDKSKV